MRVPAALMVFGVSLLGGCLNADDGPRIVLVEASPAPGLEPAWAAARAQDGDVVLLSLKTFERPVSAPVGEDAEPWGFYEPVFGHGDSLPGDGAAPAWLWTFGALEGPGLQVITSGADVVGTQPTPDFWVAQDNAGMLALPVGLFMDTPSLARAMDASDPGWSKGSFAFDAIQWTLQARGHDPLWIVEGALTPGGTSTTFSFDALTGEPPEAPFVPPSPGPNLQLTGCRNFGGVFPVPMDSARAVLPEGFEPVPTPSDPAGGATLYVLGLSCEGSSVDGADTGPATLAYAELAVIPPADQKLAGITDATVPLVFAATPQAVGDALAALRLGQAGFGDVAWVEHSGAGDVIVTATLGETSFTLRGAYAPGAGGALGSGDFALYGVQDGILVSKVLGSSAGGAGVDAAATMESAGVPLLAEARPVARGFSVSGFDLAFRPA